ncbi:hypothetical protein [Mucilaginibacter sp.]|uniref:hypothetical protein n=1 Tax=Mucilaginibacter sp. TaxID=1882438 RepID=UPI0025CBE8A6|nr:hypothetical protein [Mucilaginibacter sp.]
MKENERKQNRDQLIYNDYAKLWGEGLREELIWPKLEEKYYLAPSTLYRVVLNMSKQAKGIKN